MNNVPMLDHSVLLLTLGVPAAIFLAVLLAVTVLVRRRNANWARANELEAPSQTEEDKAALGQHDAKPVSDEGFFRQVQIESRVQKLAGYSTGYPGTVVFKNADFPEIFRREDALSRREAEILLKEKTLADVKKRKEEAVPGSLTKRVAKPARKSRRRK